MAIRKVRKHKTVRRRRAKKTARRFVNRIVPFIPNKRFTKHVYADEYIVSSLAASSSVVRVFRGNSMYDPDLTGTGHQPYGFDQMASLYKYFNVKSSRVEVYWVPSSGGANVILALNSDATALTTPTISAVGDLFEKFSGTIRIAGDASAGTNVVKLRKYQKTGRMSSDKWTSLQHAGTAAADCSDGWNWNIGLLNNNATGAVTGKLYIKITYYALWTQPLEFTQS